MSDYVADEPTCGRFYIVMSTLYTVSQIRRAGCAVIDPVNHATLIMRKSAERKQ